MNAPSATPRELIEQSQGLVRSLAAKIHRGLPPQVELDDLIAYGQLGLAEAANEYDPSRGIQFSTYAYYRVRGAIHDGLSKMSWVSRARYNRLRKEALADQVLAENALGEEASPSETLADDARWLSQLAKRLAVVYLAHRRGGDEDDDSDQDPADDRTPTAQEVLERRELHELLRTLIESLPADAGQLIRATYFEGLSQQEAAQRIGVSKSWASRLHAKTLDRLARGLRQIGAVE